MGDLQQLEHRYVLANGMKIHVAEQGSENPHGADRLSFLDLIGDVVGLIQALGQDKVYVAGHDIGAALGWHICASRPDLVKGYVSFGLPYLKLKALAAAEGSVLPPHDGFYVNRFMQPGRADADFGRFDIRTVFTNIYKLLSKLDLPVAAESQEIMDLIHPSEPLPTFLSEEDVRVYVEHYEKSGFSNPLRATYINIRRNSEQRTS